MRKNTNTKISVFVAMSGGVDSSLSACLLKEQGYNVTGVFMKNWSGDNYGIQSDCPWEKDQHDVEDVCKTLEIPFQTFNFEKEYHSKVISYFFSEFRAGRTPNPDVICNKEIKFGLFLEKALEMGADMIATGHYAQVRFNNTINEFELLRGKDPAKDQSYFLCELNQAQLSKTLFPIGRMLKTEVRILAEKQKIPVSNKPDSQGICFVGEINVGKFLRANIKINKGEIIDIDNNQLVGLHDGIEFYTIGQREGLNISGSKEPYFVVSKDKIKNIIFVAMGNTNPRLFSLQVHFGELNWINLQTNTNMQNLVASIRYRGPQIAGDLDLNNSFFNFAQPQRAIAQGQKIVIYENDILRASATII